MSASTWRLTIVVLIVLVAAWVAGSQLGAPIPLRTAHGEPARTLPSTPVIVTGAGKVFHREGCTFIHGPAVSEPADRAVAQGYTPCTRCLPQ